MKYYEKKQREKSIFKGRVLHLHVDDVELSDGTRSTREIISHPGGVAILAFTKEHEVLLVKQFRYAIHESILEIPAGRMDQNETHFDCAIRELKEETGYISKEVSYLGQMFPTPGYSSEVIHLYLAKNCVYTGQTLEEGEFLDVIKMSYEDVLNRIQNNEIWDAKTIIALLKYDKLTKTE